MKKYNIIKAIFTLQLIAIGFIAKPATCPDGVAVNITGTPTNCNLVTLTANVTGGTGNITYAWSGGNSASSVTNTFSSSNTYMVTVTDGNTCTATATKVVVVNANPTPAFSGTTTGCGSVTITASGGSTYAWSSGSATTSAINTFTTTGTYNVSVTVTNSNNCSASAFESVTVNPLPSPNISGSGKGCPPITLTASGGTTYAWSGGNYPSSAVNKITSSGTYTVTVTNSYTCTATASSIDTVLFAPSALITPGGGTSFCTGSSLMLAGPSSGNAVNFSAGYISATGKDLSTGNFTIEAWIFPVANTTGVIAAQGGINCGVGYVFEFSNDSIILQTATSSGCQGIVASAGGLVLNQWQHVAVSVTRGSTGNQTIVYIDGKAVASGNIRNGSLTNTSLTIGGSATSGYNFNGTIDEVRIYNTAQTQLDIQNTMYAIIPSNSPGLVTYYRLDEGSGTTTSDLAGGVSGTFNGTTSWLSPSSSPVEENTGQNILYNWSTSAVGAAIEVTEAGSYVLLTTSTSTSCTSTDTIIITTDTVPVPVITGSTSICSGSAISLSTGSASSYLWSGPDSFSTTGQNVSISAASSLASGVYSVIVTNSNGCTGTTRASVTVHSNPVASASNNGPQCAGSALTLSASGGVLYVWSGPNSFASHQQDTSIASATSAAQGTYTVTVSDVNGCSATASTIDTVNPLPVVNPTTNGTVCSGSALILTVSGGATYLWNGPNSQISVSAADTVNGATTDATGEYDVTVTDINGCSATASVSATVNAAPTGTAGSNSPVCSGSTLHLTASGGTSYAWSGPSFTSSSQNPDVASPSTGTYSVTITNANGCTESFSLAVTVNSPPAAPSASSSAAVCVGGNITLSSSSAGSYQWSGPNNFTSTQQDPVISSAIAADSGTYTVTVTTNGCSATATATAVVHAAVQATAGNSTVGTQCSGENISLSASGGTGYSWSGPIGFGSTQQNPTIVSANAAASGTYTVTVTAANGCSATASTSLTVIDVPAVAVAGPPDTICAGETLELTSGGGIAYAWTGPNGFVSQSQDTSIANVGAAAAGVYHVVVTNAGGCTALDSTVVTVHVLPTINTCPGNIAQFADAHLCSAVVNFSVTATGNPTPVIWYSQNPGTVYPVGTTTVIANAHNTCGAVTCNFTVTVVDNQPPAFTCPGNVTVIATQATGTKVLTIITPTVTDNCGVAGITNSFNGTSNASGTYPTGVTNVVWTATDVNGNTSTCTQVITILPRVSVVGTVTNTLCPGTFLGAISTQVAGGQGPYHYAWSNGSTAANLTGLAANTYYLTVTDAVSNSLVDTFVVASNLPYYAPASPGPISGPSAVCASSTVTYFLAPVPNTVSYTWTVPSNTTIVSGQGTTQLTLQIASAFSSGNLSVAAVNCVGIGNSCGMGITKLSVPYFDGDDISGPSQVCTSTSQAFNYTPSVADTSGAAPATLKWAITGNASIASGQGTGQVTLAFASNFTSGVLSLTGSNCTGNGGTVTYSLTAATAAAKVPGAISPTGAVCPGDTVTYTCGLSTNASSYTWTAPANAVIVSGQGTNIVRVAFQSGYITGSLGVTATNCKGTSTKTSQSIALNSSVPPAPASINSNNGTPYVPCIGGDTIVYSISPVSNARSYTWTAPIYSTIIAGQGTTAITVVFANGFYGGNLSVYASNCAGNGAASTQYIDLPPAPPTCSNIYGYSTECPGFVYPFNVVPGNNILTTYTWTMPTGAILLSGQGTTNITVQFLNSFTGGNISVLATNCAGSAPVQTQWVSLQNQAPNVPNVSGVTNNACIGDIDIFTATFYNATSYLWTVPANTTILSGQGSASITLQFNTGYTGGYIGLTAYNCAGSNTSPKYVITHNNCGSREIDSGNINGITDPASAEFEVKLFPNPTAGKFYINITGFGSEPVAVKVFSITGQLVEERKEVVLGDNIEMNGNFAPGVYLVQVSQAGVSKTLRMVKSE